jgi:hypothetical protein
MAEPAVRSQAAEPMNGRQIIGRYLKRALAAIVLIAGASYGIDYLVLRLRIATNRQPFGTVTIQPYYAVPQKDHRTEFLFDPPEQDTCVHSFFPHLGDNPCWYLSGKKERRIDM